MFFLSFFKNTDSFTWRCQVLVVARWSLVGVRALGWDTRDLGPWPGMEPGPPALGPWSLSHWATREALLSFFSQVGLFCWLILFKKLTLSSHTYSFAFASCSSFPKLGFLSIFKLSPGLFCPPINAFFFSPTFSFDLQNSGRTCIQCGPSRVWCLILTSAPAHRLLVWPSTNYPLQPLCSPAAPLPPRDGGAADNPGAPLLPTCVSGSTTAAAQPPQVWIHSVFIIIQLCVFKNFYYDLFFSSWCFKNFCWLIISFQLH